MRQKNHASMLQRGIFILLALISVTFFSSPLALLAGFIFALCYENPFEDFTKLGIKYILKFAIVGLGFSIHVSELKSAGLEGLKFTIISIAAILILGYVLGKKLNIQRKLTWLISCGTAICGGSAIAAVSSVIKPKAHDISVSLGVVFMLNALALFIFPPIGHFFNMSQYDFGLWSAIAIHDTSSVVGSAMSYGNEALKVATTVKLARTLWIIPISILSGFMFKNEKGKIQIPLFILFFVIAILIGSYIDIPVQITDSITFISKKLLIFCLFLIGTTLSLKNLKQAGHKPFILAVSIWIFISVFSFLMINFKFL